MVYSLKESYIIRKPDYCPKRVDYLTSSHSNARHWVLISSCDPPQQGHVSVGSHVEVLYNQLHV